MRPESQPEFCEARARPNADQATWAAIFDLDGVLTDTTEFHYQSWKVLADELGIPFDRRINDGMRGLSRPESLAILLRGREGQFNAAQQERLTVRKNENYLRFVAQMTPADLFPGARELLGGLRGRGVRVAIASSSKNAGRVVERLGIGPLLDVMVDANTAPRSKPDPQVFLVAAERLAMPAARCVVIEDAHAGVEAALAGGMWVIGIGPAERVAGAHVVRASIGELDVETVLKLLERGG